MKAQLVSRFIDPNSSLAIRSHSSNFFLKQWHFHTELELFVVLESSGIKFVGDCVEPFKAGEIILLGNDLPHLWQNDKIYFSKKSGVKAKALIVHFSEHFVENISPIPEMDAVNRLLDKAKRGIKFTGTSNKVIIEKIAKMTHNSGFERMLAFLEVLQLLSKQKNYALLSSQAYLSSFKEIRNSKILPVYDFVMNNFKEDIRLAQVAKIANMNASSFSRYFTANQKKTFTQFLNEIRIGYACKLLIEEKSNITGACYECGYNNISNFNRQFKIIKKKSPSEFIKLYKKNN